MNFEFTPNAWEDFLYWLDEDADMAEKMISDFRGVQRSIIYIYNRFDAMKFKQVKNSIKELLKAIRKDPFKGIGKPEPLKFGLNGYWSRRINGEHRLVYTVMGRKGKDQKCIILQCRFHYDIG